MKKKTECKDCDFFKHEITSDLKIKKNKDRCIVFFPNGFSASVICPKNIDISDKEISDRTLNRSCFTCENHIVCFAFHGLHDILKKLQINIDGDAAPNKMKDIFEGLGGACLLYRSNEIKEK